VETLTPRVQERLKRVAPKAAADIVEVGPVEAGQPRSRKALLIAGLLVIVGLGMWRSLRTSPEDALSPAPFQEPGAADFDSDPDLAAGRI
jgi:hypothetical protein